jgi:hypothetical protein
MLAFSFWKTQRYVDALKIANGIIAMEEAKLDEVYFLIIAFL